MDSKQITQPSLKGFRPISRNAWLSIIILASFFLAFTFWYQDWHPVFPQWSEEEDTGVKPAALVRSYHLRTGVRWMNPGEFIPDVISR